MSIRWCSISSEWASNTFLNQDNCKILQFYLIAARDSPIQSLYFFNCLCYVAFYDAEGNPPWKKTMEIHSSSFHFNQINKLWGHLKFWTFHKVSKISWSLWFSDFTVGSESHNLQAACTSKSSKRLTGHIIRQGLVAMCEFQFSLFFLISRPFGKISIPIKIIQ